MAATGSAAPCVRLRSVGQPSRGDGDLRYFKTAAIPFTVQL